jgi:sec-independent protein translocase protein TatC
MKKARQKTKTTPSQAAAVVDGRRPFIEHVHELRRRIFYIALSIGVWGSVAYAVEHQIVHFLLRPAKDQQFIYTSPGGGIDFLFRLCLYVGIIMSIPVIVYQLLRYVQPLLKQESTKFIAIGSSISGVLAVIGMAYGYFWGLPAALEFLLNQFVTKQIQPLVTIQSYMSFVLVYMLGSAMLLQVPLVLIFINRIKPIKPKMLLKYERHVIVAAIVLAALMNPTPNIFALLFIAAPIVFMYQVGIFIIWRTNLYKTPHKRAAHVVDLIEQDLTKQAERLSRAQSARPLLAFAPAPIAAPTMAGPSVVMAADTTPRPYVSRPTPRPQRAAVKRHRLVS